MQLNGVESGGCYKLLFSDFETSDRYKVSRVFTDACAEGLINHKMGTGMKNREYVPFWAVASEI